MGGGGAIKMTHHGPRSDPLDHATTTSHRHDGSVDSEEVVAAVAEGITVLELTLAPPAHEAPEAGNCAGCAGCSVRGINRARLLRQPSPAYGASLLSTTLVPALVLAAAVCGSCCVRSHRRLPIDDRCWLPLTVAVRMLGVGKACGGR